MNRSNNKSAQACIYRDGSSTKLQIHGLDADNVETSIGAKSIVKTATK